MAALLGGEAVRLSDEELRRIQDLVEQAKGAQQGDQAKDKQAHKEKER